MKKVDIKTFKKKIYGLGISPDAIRGLFGDLRFRKTWERAFKYYFQSPQKHKQSSNFSWFYQFSLLDIIDFVLPQSPARLRRKRAGSCRKPFSGIQLSLNFNFA